MKKIGEHLKFLNLGKYQRQHYIYDGKTERDEIKIAIKKKKEKEFKKLILDAYKANQIEGFKTIHGKKSDNLCFYWTNQSTFIKKPC